MKKKRLHWRNSYFAFIVFLLLLVSVPAGAQILQDINTVDLIRQGIGNIYNQEFENAEAVLAKLNARYPGHPANYLYRGILIYYGNYPLIPANPESKNLEQQLRKGIELCEAEDGWLDDPETLLIDLCLRGLLLLYYAENDLSKEVIPLVFTTYKCVMRSFQFTSVYTDFCYFTGLYNYYREAYPDYHPVYKPIAIFFRRGDRAKGLGELQYSADNSLVLRAESFSILSYINIYFEKNYSKALSYSRDLYRQYPSNPLFRGEYIKILFLLKKYDEAEKLVSSPEKINNLYYKTQLEIFNGLLQEMKYHNFASAERYYRKGITDLEKFSERGKEFSEIGIRGLKRLAALKDGRQPPKRKAGNVSDEIDPSILKFD